MRESEKRSLLIRRAKRGKETRWGEWATTDGLGWRGARQKQGQPVRKWLKRNMLPGPGVASSLPLEGLRRGLASRAGKYAMDTEPSDALKSTGGIRRRVS